MIHHHQPILMRGAPLDQARLAVILLHGRGASAEDILTLADALPRFGVAFFAPQAANGSWYPNRFIAPVETNEPHLTSALEVVGDLTAKIVARGIPHERIMLLGFSQGACLALEFAARNPCRYGGVFGLSGALIENGDRPRDYAGDMAGAPVFLGCSEADLHIPLERVHRTTMAFHRLGAVVTERIYPGLGHTVNEDELAFIAMTMQGAV
ncbi:MAG: phospholipase/carboxylesterase [Candidatus Roseilinea sp.]|nr:MAG: phospholipase/carboxylesterase [Candidatus Roseilinea sp.]